MEQKYSVNTNNQDKQENESHIYRHPLALQKNLESFMQVNTIQQIYQKCLEKPKSPFLGKRKQNPDGSFQQKFTWYNVQKVFDTAEKFGSGLKNLNLIQSTKDWQNMELKFIGFYSINTVRLITADISCGIYNYTIIPLYDTLGEEAFELVLKQTKLQTLLLSYKNFQKILKNKEQNKFSSIHNFVILDSENIEGDIQQNIPEQCKVFTFEQVIDAGAQNIQSWEQVNPDDVYAFSYTSGTTGDSKGAMITHKNICSVASNIKYRMEMSDQDSYLSYLPMPHVMERAIINTLIYYQVKIGLYSGNPQELMEDLKYLQPTIFASVPRIFNKMYDKMQDKVSKSSRFIQSAFNSSMNNKIQNLQNKNSYSHWFYDLVFFNKTKKLLGGKVKVVITGSAPISPTILNHLKVAFQCPIIEGYGQTEGTALEFCTSMTDPTSGHVGGPIPHNEYKLVDVPELDYYHTDKDDKGHPKPRGEIWVRGPNIIKGYYLLDEKNKETFTQDGWLQSGDIGEIILPEGKLRIIDRKKNIFKLSQGEYIAPEKLENAYAPSHVSILDIFVYGDSLKSALVAVLNVDINEVQKIAEQLHVKDDLLNNEEIKKFYLQEIEKKRVENNFNSLEKIRDLKLVNDNWEQNDLLTTTMKKKRNQMSKFYKEKIDEMYSKID